MERLTRREEDVMHIIWKCKRVFVKDVIAEMSSPKPPYSTISSIVRILDQKGFVGHETFGKTYRYFPLVSKREYRKNLFVNMVNKYFEGSMENLLSFIIREEKLTTKDLKELKKIIDQSHE
ncbi:BlaI/MecI/CopY family transcriptional regulator [Fulvivirgaceae bacterium BMA10]|uniref:BlaI/MecI/CopY family transcriptional regulator n=1 Tax=Splendidivirga corallicola TaxID=3051826 RepID=A0ABT8KZW7_9BACT|nr:BlaI/MecI/CopY family transcriptional regulator [Fulvivirgaceae bacterium BMA10]